MKEWDRLLGAIALWLVFAAGWMVIAYGALHNWF